MMNGCMKASMDEQGVRCGADLYLSLNPFVSFPLMHLHFFNLLSLCFTINFALSISLSGMCGHPWFIISAKDTDSEFGNIKNLGVNILKFWCVFPFPFWCDVGSSGIQLQVLVHHFREIMAGIQAASHTTSVVKIKEKIYTSLLLSSLTLWDSPA